MKDCKYGLLLHIRIKICRARENENADFISRSLRVWLLIQGRGEVYEIQSKQNNCRYV